jgi:malate dehydrogenase (oxaloacetate-decarboxylating)
MDTFELHSKHTGKLKIESVIPINDKETLSNIYTPNVGKICMAIKDDPELIKKYTIAGKVVAVISDGSAVLGFGNIGPKAGLPVMEGKCVIFKELAGIDAYPLCLSTKSTEEFIQTVKSLALNFAAINLEDIAAPQCFEIEDRLSNELDIPVIHDDQHGTSIVVLAALLGAYHVTGRKNLKIVVSGAGAAGTNIVKILVAANKANMISISSIKSFDSKGLISTSRKDLTPMKIELANLTKQDSTQSINEGLLEADVFIGVSIGGALSNEMIKSMAAEPIIFALANPTPEIMPEEAVLAGAVIVASGRSDYPNQINNALAYPGMFKGLLKAKIKKVTMEHKLAVAKGLFEYQKPNMSKDSLLPSILDRNIPDVIANCILSLSK